MHDSHCHFLSESFFAALAREAQRGPQPDGNEIARELGWDPPGSPDVLAERWVQELDRNKVSRAALIASVPGDEDAVAVAVKRYPDRFVGFFVLNAAAPDAENRARRAFGELGLRAACLFAAMHRYRLDDPRVAAIFEIAAAHQGAIFAHCGYLSIEARTRLRLSGGFHLQYGDPLALAATALRFPTVPVIVPHFGGGFFREALMAADCCATIHFDTSSSNGWVKYIPGLTLADVFRQALIVAGADRLIFGTDSSFFPRGWRRVICGSQRAALEEIGAEPETVNKIFQGNFERLFGKT